MKSFRRIDSPRILEFKRISLRIFKIVNFKVDIRFRPVKMGTVKKLHILDFSHGLIPEERIILIAQEILPAAHEKPYPFGRDILNADRNVFPML